MFRIVMAIIIWGLLVFMMGVPVSAGLALPFSFEMSISILTLVGMFIYGISIWREYRKTEIPLSKIGVVIALALLALGMFFVELAWFTGIVGSIIFGSMGLACLRENVLVGNDTDHQSERAVPAALASGFALCSVLVPAFMFLAHGSDPESWTGEQITVFSMVSLLASFVIAGCIDFVDCGDCIKRDQPAHS